jgi:cathepsin A (carboxypeptidase C)
MTLRVLFLLAAVITVVNCAHNDAPTARETADTILPEPLGEEAQPEWLLQRQKVWEQDQQTLARDDKTMHQSLRSELTDETSAHWPRYLRHKGLQDVSPEGHSWEVEGMGTVEGSLVQTSAPKSQLCDTAVQQQHGYFNLVQTKTSEEKKSYFYWMFEARHNPDTAPLIMWLTGGPGCSSEVALFIENGPCTVTEDGSDTKTNKYSWTEHANMIFLDQPAGAGFSTGEHDRNQHQVSEDLYHFLQEFVKKYPKYHKNPFYVMGESYAGHFIPVAAHKIMQRNAQKEGEYLPLKGVAIGNGQTNPLIQYKWYPEMAYKSTSGTKPAIDKDTYDTMKRNLPNCLDKIARCQTDDSACETAFTECNQDQLSPVQDTGVSMYNLNEQCGSHALCFDYSHIRKYLRSDKVKNVLGVKKDWSTCDFGINDEFHTDWMHIMSGHIPPLLENGQRVLIYAGDYDFICNWMGNKAWVLDMPWAGKKEFNAAKDMDWKSDGKVVGRERKHGNLQFVQVHEAGHMVPHDKPEVALMMAKKFLQRQYLVPEEAEDSTTL